MVVQKATVDGFRARATREFGAYLLCLVGSACAFDVPGNDGATPMEATLATTLPAATKLAVSTSRFELAMREAPGRATLVAVAASGSGCPAATWGTWSRDVEGNDATDFGIRFTGYTVGTMARDVRVAKDCRLVLQLESGTRTAYAVRAISYVGEATIRAGARASVAVGHAFDTSNEEAEVDELVVRRNGKFALAHDVPQESAQWSSCGMAHALRISTHVALLNESSTEPSDVKLTDIADLELYERACAP